MRWEIERILFKFEEKESYENIQYVNNKDYDNAIGIKVIAYNLLAISNIELGDSRMEIMKIISC